MTRLWTLHPSLLDQKGIGGCWRERYTAELGLRGLTENHANHSALIRFKAQPDPVAAIGCYGIYLWDDANRRGYHYNFDLIHDPSDFVYRIPVTEGQVEFEYNYLFSKLFWRGSIKEAEKLREYTPDNVPLHPLFYRVEGDKKEEWEKQ